MGFSGWECVIIAPPKRDGWLQMADCGQWQALFFINSQFHLNLTETIPLSREWHLVFSVSLGSRGCRCSCAGPEFGYAVSEKVWHV